MIEFFDAAMANLNALCEGERLMQVHTTNSMDNDGLCFIATTDEIESEDFEDEVKFALRRKYGRLATSLYVGIEDITDMYYDEDGNVL